MRQSVHSITDAPVRHSAEQHQRIVRYTIAMSIRMVCFIGAAVVAVAWESWWALVLAAAATVLPYTAVVNANAGADRYMAQREAADTDQPQVTAAGEQSGHRQWWEQDPQSPSGAESSAEEPVIDGQVVDRPEEQTRRQERGS